MYNGFYEENDNCPECLNGKLELVKDGVCSCHISPPCSACVNAFLKCDKCGYEPKEPEYVDVPVIPFEPMGVFMREFKPKPLDKTKIDWRVKMHTGSSQICEGVYPDGTTSEQVEQKVKGSFGGRFESFGNGKFKYIAYTD